MPQNNDLVHQVLVLDFDGVLNVLAPASTAARQELAECYAVDRSAVVKAPPNAMHSEYTVRWASGLVADLNGLAEEAASQGGILHVVWLTSWEEHVLPVIEEMGLFPDSTKSITSVLELDQRWMWRGCPSTAKAVSLDDWARSLKATCDSGTAPSGSGASAKTCADAPLPRSGLRVAWCDDEVFSDRIASDTLGFDVPGAVESAGGSLTIIPVEPSTGLTRPQVARIRSVLGIQPQ